MNIFELFGSISLKDDGFTSGIKKATSSMESLRTKQTELISSISGIGSKLGTLSTSIATAKSKYDDSVAAIGKYKQAMDTANSSLDTSKAKLAESKSGIEAQKNVLAENSKILNDAKIKYDALKTAIGANAEATKQAKSEYDSAKQTVNENKQAIGFLNAEYRSINEEVKNNKQVLQSAKGEYNENYNASEKLKSSLNSLEAEYKSQEDGLERNQKALKDVQSEMKDASWNNFKDKLSNIADAAKKTATKIGEITVATGKFSLEAAGFAAKGIGIVSGAVSALGGIGLKYNADMENYTTNFATMLGSQEAAVAKVEQLKEMAAATPFGMAELAKGTETLLAFGIESEKTGDILQQIGDVSLGNKDKFSGLTLAFSQMSATGKLMGQDLNQMINAGFNPLQEISRTTGISIGELKEQMSDGAITADMVAEAFKTATAEGGKFYNGMEAASKTVTGLISTLQDNFQALVGEVFMPMSEQLLGQILPMALGYIDTLSIAFKENGVTGLVGAFGDIIAQVIQFIAEKAPAMVEIAVSLINSLVEGLSKNSESILTGVSNSFTAIIDGVKTILPNLVPLALEIIQTLVNGFIQWTEMLYTTGVNIITDLIKGISQMLPTLIPQAKDAIMNIVKGLAQNLPEILKSGIEIITQLALGIADMLPELIPIAIEAILTLVEALIENIDMLIDAAIEITIALAEGIINALPILIEKAPIIIAKLVTAIVKNVPKLLEAAGEIVVMLVKGIIDNLPQFYEAAYSIIMELIAGIINLHTAIKEAANNIVEKIWTVITETDWLKLGSDIISGIVKGILGGASKVWDAIKGVATGTINTAKEEFDQHSPSKVFEEIFKNNMLGAVRGVEKNKKKVTKSVEQMAKESFASAKTWIEDYRNSTDYMASEEIKMWGILGKKYTDVSKEKVEIDKKIANLQLAVIKEREATEKQSFELSKGWIETKKKLGILSMQDEIDAWERVQQRYAEGTEQRKAADIALYESQQRLFVEQEKITEKMEAAEKKYADAVDNRAQAIFNSFGLFDELKKKEEVSSSTLTENLQAQVTEMKNWAENLETLSDRGINEGLLADLQKMGPSANAEITALTKMSDSELTTYSNLYGEKQAIAKEQAINELQGMRKDTNAELKGLSDDLKKLSETNFVFAGESTAQGFIDGLKSKFENIRSAVKEMADIASSAITQSLEIASPSKLFKRFGNFTGQGFIDGIEDTATAVNNAIDNVFGDLGREIDFNANFDSIGNPSSNFSSLSSNQLASTQLTSASNSATGGNTYILQVKLDEVDEVSKLKKVFENFTQNQVVFGGVR